MTDFVFDDKAKTRKRKRKQCRQIMKRKQKKAIIFDMDGVLVDSEPIYQDMFHKFLEENNCLIDETIFRSVAGSSSSGTWEILSRVWKEKISGPELHREFRRQYPDFCIPYKEALVSGVPELICWLWEKGYVLVLASSSSPDKIDRMLRETELKPYFTYVVSGDMFRESKPNPEIYEYACSLLGLPKEQCLVIEDSTYGIHAGIAAGLEVVAVRDTKIGFDQSNATYMIDAACELKNFLENK